MYYQSAIGNSLLAAVKQQFIGTDTLVYFFCPFDMCIVIYLVLIIKGLKPCHCPVIIIARDTEAEKKMWDDIVM